jgi:hypothetical protein
MEWGEFTTTVFVVAKQRCDRAIEWGEREREKRERERGERREEIEERGDRGERR